LRCIPIKGFLEVPKASFAVSMRLLARNHARSRIYIAQAFSKRILANGEL
jgi:hypothetical protein